MTVYIEYVLIDNFVIDCLLLKYAYLLTGVKTKSFRLMLSALFGAVFALLYPLLQNGGILFSLLKLALGMLLVILGAPFKSVKKAYITTVVFYLLTFALGGTITAITTTFNVSSSETLISLIVLPAYLLLTCLGEVIKVIYRRKNVENFSYEINLTLGDKSVKALGFLDTGNNAFFKDSPMIFCPLHIFNRLIESGKIPKTYSTTINTVAGSKVRTVVIIDRLVIYIGKDKNIFNNVATCISKTAEERVILHPDMFNLSNVKEIENEIFRKT